MNYAVIFTYSFDGDVAVYLFDDEESAVRMLRENFEEERRIDVEENGWDVDAIITDDGWYAKIIDHFCDRDDITEMRIGRVYQ